MDWLDKPLAGKVALVTGGSRGLGAAIAEALADRGADVAISYVASEEKAVTVVASLRARVGVLSQQTATRRARQRRDRADANRSPKYPTLRRYP